MKRLAWWLWWMALGAGLPVALAAVAYLGAPWILSVERIPASADVIVVLGGETPNRAARTAELFRQQVARHILISGGGDASLIRRRLLDSGVPATAISVEENSANTWENAVFSVRMLRRANARSICLVTSWYHSRRSLAVFRSLAPELDSFSAPAAEDWVRYRDGRRRRLKALGEEYAKLGWYLFRYGVWPWRA